MKIISIKDEQGKEHKFEKPEFELGLEFILGEWVYGWVDDDKLNFNHKFLVAWNTKCGTAICVDGLHDGYNIYNLAPIKEALTLNEILQDVQDKQMSVDASELLIKAMFITGKE